MVETRRATTWIAVLILLGAGVPGSAASGVPERSRTGGTPLRPIDPDLLRALGEETGERYGAFSVYAAAAESAAGCEGSGCAQSDAAPWVPDVLLLPVQETSPEGETSAVGAIQPGSYSGLPFQTDLHLSTVLLRSDDLDWSIAGGPGIDVLSELTWKGVQSSGVELAGSLTLPSQWVAVGHASYGWIHGGENQDSDFDGPGRTLEFSRSNNDADGGATLDASVAIGYRMQGGPWGLEWTPLLGLGYRRQELEMTDGRQTIPNAGPFPGLDSSYDAEWFGPWTGLNVGLTPHPRLALGFGLELHRLRYRGVADWNLRDDFAHPKSFTHRADGWGLALESRAAWKMTRRWTADLSARWSRFETDAGTDTLYFADGTRSATRLNSVNWESLRVVLGVSFEF